MNKQKEIREGIRRELGKHLYLPLDASAESRLERDNAVDEFLGGILSYLHSQGVVIKVDRDPLEGGFVIEPLVGVDLSGLKCARDIGI